MPFVGWSDTAYFTCQGYIQKTSLLILDEATSNLDHESETQVIIISPLFPVQRLL